MVWDLGKAMQKKEEFESARLMDFAFRQRALATRLLARRHGLDETQLVREIAVRTEQALLDLVTRLAEADAPQVRAEYSCCLEEARRTLIAARGDPTPYRLG